MEDSRALKPKSFRIDDETAQKFKEISNTIGESQQETMRILLNAYHMQQEKAGLSEHKASLDAFESHSTALNSLFVQILQENHSMRESVMQEFAATLNSKDSVIQDLQGQLTAAKQKKESAEAQATALSEKNQTLTEENTHLQSALADKEALNIALNDSCSHLKLKCESLEAEARQTEALREIQGRYDDLLKKNESLEIKMQQEKAMHEDAIKHLKAQAQLDKDKTMLKLEKAHQESLQKFKAEKQAEVEMYQKRYADLLLQLQGQDAARKK